MNCASAVTYDKPPASWGEQEYRTLTPDDMDKLLHEIGEHFGHSSLHCIAFDGLRDALKVCQIANGINHAVASMRAKS